MSEVPLYSARAEEVTLSDDERGVNKLHQLFEYSPWPERGVGEAQHPPISLKANVRDKEALVHTSEPIGTVLNLRTTTPQKCAAVPRRARI